MLFTVSHNELEKSAPFLFTQLELKSALCWRYKVIYLYMDLSMSENTSRCINSAFVCLFQPEHGPGFMPETILKSRNVYGETKRFKKKGSQEWKQLHVLPRPIHFHVKDTVLGNKKMMINCKEYINTKVKKYNFRQFVI